MPSYPAQLDSGHAGQVAEGAADGYTAGVIDAVDEHGDISLDVFDSYCVAEADAWLVATGDRGDRVLLRLSRRFCASVSLERYLFLLATDCSTHRGTSGHCAALMDRAPGRFVRSSRDR